MKSTRIDIDPAKRAKVAALLNALLADCADMSMRTKHAHWNVRGPNFIALHTFYDELYDVLNAHGDAIAERTAAMGGFVKGRLSDAAASTRLPKYPDEALDGMATVAALADALGMVSNAVRDGIETAESLDDIVTSDLLTGVSGDLDKYLWFLEAHLR